MMWSMPLLIDHDDFPTLCSTLELVKLAILCSRMWSNAAVVYATIVYCGDFVSGGMLFIGRRHVPDLTVWLISSLSSFKCCTEYS